MKILVPKSGTFALTSPPSRGAWIENKQFAVCRKQMRSPPSRGAWIEMRFSETCYTGPAVAPLAGGVD